MKIIFKKYKPYYKDSLRLAFPVIVSQLGFTMVQTADTIIVGRFAGTIPLAAVSLAGSILIILLLIGIGIAYGITPLIAQLNGRQNYEECGNLLSNGLLINIITGVVLFGCSAVASRFLLPHLHQSKQVVQQAQPFLTAYRIVACANADIYQFQAIFRRAGVYTSGYAYFYCR